MCSYITDTTEVSGSGYAAGEWIGLRRAVVSFDHPQDAPLEHALCIDFRCDSGDPAARVAVELDGEGARRLAHTILAVLQEES